MQSLGAHARIHCGFDSAAPVGIRWGAALLEQVAKKISMCMYIYIYNIHCAPGCPRHRHCAARRPQSGGNLRFSGLAAAAAALTRPQHGHDSADDTCGSAIRCRVGAVGVPPDRGPRWSWGLSPRAHPPAACGTGASESLVGPGGHARCVLRPLLCVLKLAPGLTPIFSLRIPPSAPRHWPRRPEAPGPPGPRPRLVPAPPEAPGPARPRSR